MIHAAKPYDVIIEPRFNPDRSPGGIYFPQQSRERCSQGIVKYIGSKVESVRRGDRVGFGGYSGTLVRIENELMIIMPESEIDFIFTHETEYAFEIYQRRVLDHESIAVLANTIDEILNSTLHRNVKVKDILALVIARGPYSKCTYKEVMSLLSKGLTEDPDMFKVKRNLEDDRK